jgi:hypothetical protein
VNRSTNYVTAIVVAHLLVNIAHGLAHRELRVGLDPSASIFVIVVVLVSPLLAMVLVWTTKKRLGLILLSLSMFGSLLFGLYRHFLVASPDQMRSQPPAHGESSLSSRRMDCSSPRRLEFTWAFISSGLHGRTSSKAVKT